jgi:Fe-S cluster assembly protein SufD
MLNQLWAENLNPNDPLLNYRKKGWAQFEKMGLPRPKEEAFQYVTRKWDLPKCAEKKELQKAFQGIVFVDGFFDETSSQIAAPLVCLQMDKAMRTYGLFLQNRFISTTAQEKDPFAALNAALFGQGVFLYIPPRAKVELELLQIYTRAEMATPRIHIYLGRESELKLRQKSEGQSGFSNVFIDWVLDSGAKATFLDHGKGDIQSVRADLKRDSSFKAVFLGANLRTSIHLKLLEENAEANILGLADLSGTEESHIHAHVEHIAPFARSRQHFKSVVRDKSRYSFEGKIYVHSEALKTESYQLNNNLILGDEAIANAKPNLEIFADDVKASHGSTTGSLEKEELFYFRSRGLDAKEAKELLIQGFCQEITDHAL